MPSKDLRNVTSDYYFCFFRTMPFLRHLSNGEGKVGSFVGLTWGWFDCEDIDGLLHMGSTWSELCPEQTLPMQWACDGVGCIDCQCNHAPWIGKRSWAHIHTWFAVEGSHHGKQSQWYRHWSNVAQHLKLYENQIMSQPTKSVSGSCHHHGLGTKNYTDSLLLCT